MKEIYKYWFHPDVKTTCRIPIGGEIISSGVQDNIPCIWVMVTADEELEDRQFILINTGQPFQYVAGRMRFIDTFLLYNGQLVKHLFEIL